MLAVVVASLSVLTLTQQSASAATTGSGTSYTLEGCRNNGDIALPINGKFICPNGAYTPGNLGKGWNELDLVPLRVTVGTGNQAPADQDFSFAIAVDNCSTTDGNPAADGNINNGGCETGVPGYDFLSVPVLNTALSTPGGACGTITVSDQLYAAPGVGGTGTTLYRIVDVQNQDPNATCVYDAYARLALGSHEFPGSSLHFNALNDQLGTAGIGARDVSIPVKEISPQELRKTMTATQGSDHVWNITKESSPTRIDIANTCTGATSFSENVAITVRWEKLPATPGGPITVTTNVYAKNPASRTITVQGSDAIRSGTTVLDTVNFGPVDVPAGQEILVLTHQTTVPAGTTNLNDIATATYIDKDTGIVVPGNTVATASATVQQTGVATNSTAVITDVESITGTGLSYSVNSFSGASGSFSGGYVAGTPTTSDVTWVSASQSGSGSVTFNKTIYSTSANVTTGALSDIATLNASDGFTTQDDLSVAISTDASTRLRVSKTMSLVLANNITFNFHLFAPPNVDQNKSTSVTIPAGQTGPVLSDYVFGLSPTGTYFFKEDASAPYPAQNTGQVTFALTPGDPDTCRATIPVTNEAAPPTARVKKDTVPVSSGNWTMTLTGPNGLSETLTNVQAGAGYFDFSSVLDVDGGVYTITETQQAGYDLTSVTGDFDGDTNRVTTSLANRTCSFTLNLATDSDDVFSCAFVNTLRGRIIVQKVTQPSGATQSFEFDSNYGSNFFLSDGQSNDSGELTPGTYSVAEVNIPAGWDLVSATCDDGSQPSAIGLGAGETVTCTFTNRQRGKVEVIKTVSGNAPTGSDAFTFQLRSGATTKAEGTILETEVANAGNGGNISFDTALVPGDTYQLCEAGMLPGWTTTLTGFVPNSLLQNGDPNPDVDNSVVCQDFTVEPGQTKVFTIDNTPPPGGDARTIGFWKNWSSCSGGRQDPVLDETLASFPGGGVLIGDLFVDTCQEAVRILNKSAVTTGKKYASDPLINMAAQLLAAKLNVQAGAGVCPAAVTAINNAQALLDAQNWVGAAPTGKLKGAVATTANNLAGTLDAYNNNELC
ncbi:MAG TPA: hypothetical protein VFK52_04395 [Nocardioidaceae bacterium]|nr:hypothetical protein [Nocardioidaceae bacterium]